MCGADHPTSKFQPQRAQAPGGRDFARACHERPIAVVCRAAAPFAFAAALALANSKGFVREILRHGKRAGIIACAGFPLALAGCNPVLESRYRTEGAGVDLYTSDRAGQVELLNQYVSFVCAQAGPDCGSNWSTFVQAGMNDIDLRCDGFLTWLDAKRRDREPIIAEISAINTAVHAVMTVTGASPKSLEIVTAAFGLGSASYANWNSRLLISINQSTVQDVVYTGQGEFREKIKNWPVPDQPMAIYLLRNYLRLCMPTTIEAAVNTSATLVQRGDLVAARKNLIVKNTALPDGATVHRSSFRPDEPTEILEKFLDPDGDGIRENDRVEAIVPYLTKIRLTRRSLTRFLNGAEFAAQRRELVAELKRSGKL